MGKAMNQTRHVNGAEQAGKTRTLQSSVRAAPRLINATAVPSDLSAHAAPHALPVAAVYTALATQPYGLTQAKAAERLQRYGPNLIREIKGTPLIVKFLANFTHLMAILLWVGG